MAARRSSFIASSFFFFVKTAPHASFEHSQHAFYIKSAAKQAAGMRQSIKFKN